MIQGSFCLLLSSNVKAQNSNNKNLILADGTPIKLRLNREMSSKDAKTGESVDLEVLRRSKNW